MSFPHEDFFERAMMNMIRRSGQPMLPRPRRSEARNQVTESWYPSMHHDGCINTACWLNVPWRLSSSSSSINNGTCRPKYVPESHTSSVYEIPTQVVTSGDDCMIKVWDLKNSMGTVSPLEGGWDTFSPLTLSDMNKVGTDDTYKSWVKFYEEQNENSKIAGSVNLLATIPSGHRANVFHVQPLFHKPGKFLSCGADGLLRLSDVELSSSAGVYIVEGRQGISITMMSMERVNERMVYSFQFLSQDTGLLCSDQGLFRFDIRLRPNEQSRVSLYRPNSSRGTYYTKKCCKACAVWRPHQYRQYGTYPVYDDHEMESSYVFAGGSGEYVELLDLRMIGGTSSNNVLERYYPSVFKDGKPSVCVSGIDVTRDGRELLVSYENDQIYTFKVFGDTSCSTGPSSTEIEESRKLCNSDSSRSTDYHAMYGGHVNCITFLKQATYAGPNDEYILTGGDLGKAWIYERSTGAVAAVLTVDRNACNGFVPHPTLPYFITYGIDKSAKLWRAPPTPDSPLARAEASVQWKEYQLGPLSRQWNKIVLMMGTRESTIPNVFPDVILTQDKSEEDLDLCGHVIADISGGYAAFSAYGNSLRCLEFELSDTKSRYYHGKLCDSSSNFLAQGLHVHTIGITWRRLQSHATRLGMRTNILAPWVFEAFINTSNPIHGFHRADLVPDCPSDWIQYHPLMQNVPFPEAYSSLIGLHKAFPEQDELIFDNIAKKTSLLLPWLSDELQESYMNMETNGWDAEIPDSVRNAVDIAVEEDPENKNHGATDSITEINKKVVLTALQVRSRRILEDTVEALKNGGNEAMKMGLHYKAAQRYDKAVGYCAVALMPHLESDKLLFPFSIGHIKYGEKYDNPPGTQCKQWSPILRNLLAIRLNLSLLMLKPEFHNPLYAADLAEMALGQLHAYTAEQGKVTLTPTMTYSHEPIETYLEAMTIQSKAYFRLGCAQYELKDFTQAVKCFQESLDNFHIVEKIMTSVNPSIPPRSPDPALLRRLHDAKVQMKKKKERTNKKFISAIGSSSPPRSSKSKP